MDQAAGKMFKSRKAREEPLSLSEEALRRRYLFSIPSKFLFCAGRIGFMTAKRASAEYHGFSGGG